MITSLAQNFLRPLTADLAQIMKVHSFDHHLLAHSLNREKQTTRQYEDYQVV
jgi:hypothetical protein